MLQVKDFTAAELTDIISRRKLPDHASPVLTGAATQHNCRHKLATAAFRATQDKQKQAASALSQLVATINNSTAVGGLHLTLREVMKILRRHVVLGLSLPAAVISLLAACTPLGSKEAAALQQHLRQLGGEFATVVLPQASDYTLEPLGPKGGVRFSAGLDISVEIPAASLDRSSICSKPDQIPAAFRAGLVHLAFAVAAGEPVMLIGPTCFKSRLVTVWAEFMGLEQDLVKVHLSPGTEIHKSVIQIRYYMCSNCIRCIAEACTSSGMHCGQLFMVYCYQ